MKALILNKYGGSGGLKVVERERPTPKPGEVLVKVHAASINAADRLLTGMMGRLFGFGLLRSRKKIMGSDFSGEIVAKDPAVDSFSIGDAVFGDLSSSGHGAFAEYVAVPIDRLTHKPGSVSFEDAAALPMAACTALCAVKKAHIKPGQHMLIYGASGGVGSFAVQITKSFGAVVTGVCSTRNIESIQKLGADHVIDYQREDSLKTGNTYDTILAVNGNRSWNEFKRVLNENGRCVAIGGKGKIIAQASLFGEQSPIKSIRRLTSVIAKANQKDLTEVASLAASGSIKPLIDRTFPLSESVAAFEYLQEHHASGKVVITMDEIAATNT